MQAYLWQDSSDVKFLLAVIFYLALEGEILAGAEASFVQHEVAADWPATAAYCPRHNLSSVFYWRLFNERLFQGYPKKAICAIVDQRKAEGN